MSNEPMNLKINFKVSSLKCMKALIIYTNQLSKHKNHLLFQ